MDSSTIAKLTRGQSIIKREVYNVCRAGKIGIVDDDAASCQFI